MELPDGDFIPIYELLNEGGTVGAIKRHIENLMWRNLGQEPEQATEEQKVNVVQALNHHAEMDWVRKNIPERRESECDWYWHEWSEIHTPRGEYARHPLALACLASASAQAVRGEAERYGSTADASGDNKPTEQSPNSSDNEPFLAQGLNPRAAVEKWVQWHAKRMATDFSKVTDIAENIHLLAKKHGYQSQRGEMTIASITKMIPAGLTGGRGKNKGKPTSLPGLVFGKGVRKGNAKPET
jgi:hypothetical protein